MKLAPLIAALPIVLLGSLSAPAQEPDRVAPFMKAKLEHAKKLIEALAVEDYAQLGKHSQELSLISQATTWQVLQTADYRNHSMEFRRATDALKTAAEKKNLDGATLAYVELTLRCVQCHKYVRNVRATDAGPQLLPPADPRVARLINSK